MRGLVAVSLVCGCGALVLQTNHSLDVSEDLLPTDQLLHVKALLDGAPCLGGWNAINPSFAPIPRSSDFAVAMRGLCLTKSNGHASWYSKMVVGTIPASDLRGPRANFEWKSLNIAPDLRKPGGSLKECHLPGLDKAQGPEDPRLVKTEDGIYAIVTGYNVLEHEGADSPVCGKHAMLLYAAKVESLSPTKFGHPVRLTFDGMGQVEKNWAMFTSPEVSGSNVFAVYSVAPHTIAKVDLRQGQVKFIAHSESEGLKKLAHQLGVQPHDFHGGAGVAHAKGYQGQYFLSVLHTAIRRKDGGKEYWNYPYKFSMKPPYQILRIGKKLPLQLNRNPAYGEYVAFVTTVMMDHEHIFIGYGSGDRSSRTLRIPQDEFEAKFFPHTSLEQVGSDLAEDVDEEDLDLLASGMVLDSSSVDASRDALNCSDDLTPTLCRSRRH